MHEHQEYQARWASRQRAEALRKAGLPSDSLLLDTFNGHIVVEPAGANLGDGAPLSPLETEFELQAAWFLGPKSKLCEARRRLGLEAEQLAASAV